PSSGFGSKDVNGNVDNTSTQDLLLYRDLVEAVVLSSFQEGMLVSSADAVLNRMRGIAWRRAHIASGPAAAGDIPFFDGEGNGAAGTGEDILWLKPIFDGNSVL